MMGFRKIFSTNILEFQFSLAESLRLMAVVLPFTMSTYRRSLRQFWPFQETMEILTQIWIEINDFRSRFETAAKSNIS